MRKKDSKDKVIKVVTFKEHLSVAFSPNSDPEKVI